MKKGTSNKAIYRKDYQPYAWTVGQLELYFSIGDEATEVRSSMTLEQDPAAAQPGVLELDGKQLELLEKALKILQPRR